MLYLIVIDVVVTPIDSSVPTFSSSNYAQSLTYNFMDIRSCEMLYYLYLQMSMKTTYEQF